MKRKKEQTALEKLLQSKSGNFWWLNLKEKKKGVQCWVFCFNTMILEQHLETAVKILRIQRSEPPITLPPITFPLLDGFPNCLLNKPTEFSDSLTFWKAMKQF